MRSLFRRATTNKKLTLRTKIDAAGIDNERASRRRIFTIEHENAVPLGVNRQLDTGHRRDGARPGAGGIDRAATGNARPIRQPDPMHATVRNIQPDHVACDEFRAERSCLAPKRLKQSPPIEPTLAREAE